MTRARSAILLFSLLAVSCGGAKETKPVESSPASGVDYPKWVMGGSGVVNDDDGRSFMGVGSVNGIRNQGLAVTTADNRARAELSKVFEVYSASLMKDYMAATTAGDMSASSEEQHVEQAIKTFSAQTLSGVQITEHWFHPDGTVYSLARLDLAKFADAMNQMKELSEQVKNYVRKNAERVHMDLENEEAKHATP